MQQVQPSYFNTPHPLLHPPNPTPHRDKSLDRSTEGESETQFIHSPPTQHHNSKYKIQLCRNFMINTYCPYGQRCQYAHGTHELRTTNFNQIISTINNPQILPSNQRYKTKPCRQFFKKGYCVYGQTCNYLHKTNGQTIGIQQITKKIDDQGFKQIIKVGENESRLLRILKINSQKPSQQY